ncbi:hypothetical protein [Nonomuraea dietziae]|uniref:hypothetical protein n=1 Tax=Nonomuraea dietziae TaxID=65515 RepID=UPI0031D714CD
MLQRELLSDHEVAGRSRTTYAGVDREKSVLMEGPFMISRQTVTHPFNRGDYVVGAPTPPRWAADCPRGRARPACRARLVRVPEEVVAELRAVCAACTHARDEVDPAHAPRDWWAGTASIARDRRQPRPPHPSGGRRGGRRGAGDGRGADLPSATASR